MFLRPDKSLRNSGFTLVEGAVVMAVVAVVMAFAVPSIKSFLDTNRSKSVSDLFLVAMSYARVEAISSQTNVVICPRRQGVDACETDTSKQDYAKGWVIFKDCNGDQVLDLTNVCDNNLDGTNESIELLQVESFENTQSLTLIGDTKYKNLIVYQLTGRTSKGEGTLTLQADNKTRTIALNRLGMARID